MTAIVLLTVRRAALHFSAETYERFFAGLNSLVFLRDRADLLMLPVRLGAGGGYVIKLRNGAGDRTVDAADFFRENGIEDAVCLTLPAYWSDDRAALVVQGVFN